MELGNTSVRLENPAALSAPQSPTSQSYGLKSAALSPSETLAQSIALIAPTGAPVMTVPLVFGLAGEGCALAFLISTITILLVALNVNQFARISASPGSLYTYITDHHASALWRAGRMGSVDCLYRHGRGSQCRSH
jgi:hypothetical protein